MDVYSYLQKDHRKVKNLFEQVLLTNIHCRQDLFDKIKNELLLHAISVQSVFYQTLHKYNESKEQAQSGSEDHKRLTVALEKLDKLTPHQEEWLQQFNLLKTLFERHILEEEGEIYNIAKKVLTKKQSEDIALAIEDKKQELLEVV